MPWSMSTVRMLKGQRRSANSKDMFTTPGSERRKYSRHSASRTPRNHFAPRQMSFTIVSMRRFGMKAYQEGDTSRREVLKGDRSYVTHRSYSTGRYLHAGG
jgi:hypothetical protein